MIKNIIKYILLFLLIEFLIFFAIYYKENSYEKKLNNMNQQVYIVKNGDTLWQIAKNNNSKDIPINQYIDKVLELNNISTVEISIGQEIIILK